MKTFFLKSAIIAVSIATLLLTAPNFRAASALTRPRQLSFAERSAYQYAIEEVYWRHRIWPKENPGPKPALDAVMSAAQIEKKVSEYLRTSQLVADRCHRPIMPEQLQGELERIVRDTKQPDVLREIYTALGNDPFVIAECLARPLLAERLVADLSSYDKSQRFPLLQTHAADTRFNITTSGNPTYTLPEIANDGSCTDDTWTSMSVINAPEGRQFPTSVWTGSEMIVWGGDNTSAGYFNTGGRYNPATDSWTATSTINAPTARWVHTAVWTGSEMIVWGGAACGFANCDLNTGARYSPATDSWTATSTTNAPAGRGNHTAVWTGSELIVWGGLFFDGSNHYLNTGGRYNPGTDSWIATSTANVPNGRFRHTAVWTGSEMIVWGGTYSSSNTRLDTGGRYNPDTDSWTDTNNTNAPDARFAHTAVWTGSEMIVWGGGNGSKYLSTGGRYNPATDSWTATNISSAPLGRFYHTAVWTGSEMIVWGGYFYRDGNQYQNTGGQYDPGTDSWRATRTTNAPDRRGFHTAIWTGSEMIVWGGYREGLPDFVFFDSGGRYCTQRSTPTSQSAVSKAP